MPEDLSSHTNISTFVGGGQRKANYICDIQQEIPKARIHGWAPCACVGVSYSLPPHYVSLSNPIFKADFGFEHLRICICDYSLSADLKGKHLFLYFVFLPSMYSSSDSTCSLERAASVLHAPTENQNMQFFFPNSTS